MTTLARDEAWLLDEKYNGVATDEFEIDRARLTKGEPLAYVIGWQPFLGLKIFLDSHPLIPRPETEWWTEQLLATIHAETQHTHTGPTITFLDLYAGSGAIGCAALAQLPQALVYFGEIDPAHAETIQKNIDKNRLDATRAHIQTGDMFEPFGDMRFDIIAANPPYIPADRTLPESVIDYEPPLALFSGIDGLDHMRRLAHELPQHLNQHGVAWIECDREHADDARQIFLETGLRACIRTDQYDNPRCVVVSLS